MAIHSAQNHIKSDLQGALHFVAIAYKTQLKHRRLAAIISLTNTPDIHVSRDESLQVVKRVIRENWKQYYKQYILACILLALVAASTAFPAWIIRDVVNDVFAEHTEYPESRYDC